MSYLEPLLNCDPLETPSTSSAPTTYVPCFPFTSTLFPFVSYKHSFGGQPGRSCFPPLLPAARLLQGRLRGGQESGVEPPATRPGSPSAPPMQEAGIGLLTTGTRRGPKMAGAGPTGCASLQGMPQPGDRSRGVPPSIHWQCPDPPSTDPAAAILTLPCCGGYSQRGWGQAGSPSQGPPFPPLVALRAQAHPACFRGFKKKPQT